MTSTSGLSQWQTVDEGWGRQAPQFASTLEPAACREYVAVHHHLDLRAGEALLDVACGSGLALELAALHGVHVSGIDASPRLVDIARDRSPQSDIRVGDMTALPWDDATFDVVTSFRGIWATTLDGLTEARRVLRPGGRIGITTWGHVKASPGFWALTPFGLAAPEKVDAQAAMKALGRPEVGEKLLTDAGFVNIHRYSAPFTWEFADPEAFAHAIASTGPAFEAIQQVGAAEFHRYCLTAAAGNFREGLPLRAEIDCVAFLAYVPTAGDGRGLLDEADLKPESTRMAEEDLDDLGFVTNATRLWMLVPETNDDLFNLIDTAARGAGLTVTERGIATIIAAGRVGDTYCPLAWGQKLADCTSAAFSAAVLDGSQNQLDERQKVIADWARAVTTTSCTATPEDIDRLRAVGFTDEAILQLTLFITQRVAFSTVNRLLGTKPEEEYLAHVDPAVHEAWSRIHA